jgi:hypothetical protein
MDIIVYNHRGPQLEISFEAMCIRVGIIIGQRVHSVGIAGNHIYYKRNLDTLNTTFESKVDTMRLEPGYMDNKAQTDKLLYMLRVLWKDRRKPQSLLKFKKLEHKLNVAYDAFVKETVLKRWRLGMMSLASFEEDVLVVTNASLAMGEDYNDGFNISNLLQLHTFKEKPMKGPFVFMLYDRLAELPEETMQEMTFLFNVPNLNGLSKEQLLAVRTAMRPQMEQLGQLLKHTEGADHCGGHWDKAGFAEVGRELQRALDANAEMQWLGSFNMDNVTCKVYAGEMETRSFWKHMRDKGLVPDDTWAVLEAMTMDAACPSSIPVLVARLPPGNEGSALDDMAQTTEALPRRKIISLD